MISIQMLKLCGESFSKSFELVSRSPKSFELVSSGKFPSDWKKANVVRVHKRCQTGTKRLSPNIAIAYLRKMFELLIVPMNLSQSINQGSKLGAPVSINSFILLTISINL